MKKVLKISLRVLAVLLSLILLAFIGGWIYLKQHKKETISFIEKEVNKGLNGGDLHIGDISIGILYSFPRIAFTIDTLILRDSLWHQHHHNLLSAPRAYATLNFFKLITGKISIDRVHIESPKIYIYTDTSGYTNTSIFKKKDSPKKSSPENPDYPVLEISTGTLAIDKEEEHKFFGFDIRNLKCHIQGNGTDPVLKIDVALDCKVQRMTFNPEKGPYLENKTVVGEFQIQFNKDSKVLQFEKIHLAVDQQHFIFTGKFFLAEVPTPFILSWETDNLSFRKAASFLAQNIRLKLDQYDISETITHLTGSLDNSEPEYKTPLIHLKLNVENRNIATPVVVLSNSSFIATFNNEAVRGYGHEDSNSVMHFTSFKGRWDKLDFTCDSIVINNLIHPRMKMHMLSRFPLEDINGLVDENTLAFTKGSGKLDLTYNGSLEIDYDSLRMISGSFNMDTAGILFIPRNLQFTNGNGVVRFQNKDILVDNLSLNLGSTDLVMDGKILSVFYLINQRNNKLSIEWKIRSNKLNLNDFTSFLQQKKTKSVPMKKKSSLAQSVTQFTALLETADFNLDLNAKKLIYKKFSAENIQANLEMDENQINLKKIKLQHGGGNVMLSGLIRNEPVSNPFSFKANLNNIDISKLFTGFNNFGLKSLTDKNIGGTLTAEVTMQGKFTNKAALIQDDLKGFVKFNLHNGELVNFEPVQKIQETVFKNRNFSDVQFADLHDLFEINGNNITINRMEIHSSVITMFVEGMYNMKTGPNLSIQVPLSNLKKNKDGELVNKGINSKPGVSARLRIQRGDNGKLKISWDPFNKAGKAIKAQSQKPS